MIVSGHARQKTRVNDGAEMDSQFAAGAMGVVETAETYQGDNHDEKVENIPTRSEELLTRNRGQVQR